MFALEHTDWFRFLVGAAAGVTAISILWQKVIKPIVRAATALITSATTLAEIADQFKPNHGSSLVDRISRIENELVDVRTVGMTSLQQHADLATSLMDLTKRLDEQ